MEASQADSSAGTHDVECVFRVSEPDDESSSSGLEYLVLYKEFRTITFFIEDT